MLTPGSSRDEKPEISAHLKAGKTDAIRRDTKRWELRVAKAVDRTKVQRRGLGIRGTHVRDLRTSYCASATSTTSTYKGCGLTSCLLPHWREHTL